MTRLGRDTGIHPLRERGAAGLADIAAETVAVQPVQVRLSGAVGLALAGTQTRAQPAEQRHDAVGHLWIGAGVDGHMGLALFQPCQLRGGSGAGGAETRQGQGGSEFPFRTQLPVLASARSLHSAQVVRNRMRGARKRRVAGFGHAAFATNTAATFPVAAGRISRCLRIVKKIGSTASGQRA